MKSLKQLKNCIFVYLDVHLDDIDKRLGDLKVDRIVGASSSVPPKPGFGIGNRNHDQVSVLVSAPELFLPKPKLSSIFIP